MTAENMVKETSLSEYPLYSNEWFADLYMKYGSAEKVVNRFWGTDKHLPISIAQYHRLINTLGIVKSVGRKEVNMAEIFFFFAHKAMEPTVPLAKIYRDYMPLNFETSLITPHRIYHRIKQQKTERNATALLIVPENSYDEYLVAHEKTTSLRYGKYRGDATIPMTFCKKGEDPKTSILRVLQQEVWGNYAVIGNLKAGSELSSAIIPKHPEPLFFIDILDVHVGVYKLILPNSLFNLDFSSPKVENHHFVNFNQSHNIGFRCGVGEIVEYCGNVDFSSHGQYYYSDLNFLLCAAES